MEIITEPLESRQLRLIIKLDEERTRQAMRLTARQIAKNTNFRGFRKGKAPYELVLQRYGENTLRQEVANELVQTVYLEAIEQEGIESYAPGVLDEIELEPITFTFTVPLLPTLDLGDYRDYRLDPPSVMVSQEEVQQALEQIREQNVILDPVTRPAAMNDRALIDLVGRTAGGVEFLNQDGIRILLEAQSTEPAPGFVEEIVGMEAGGERTFSLILPDEFPRKELQGQEVEFTVRMIEVYESTLPALDDDLARTIGNFDSFEELEKHVEEQLRQTAQQKADSEYAAQVLADLLDQTRVEYPPVMLERELDAAVKETEQAVKQNTRLSLEDYLRFQNLTLEELREDLKPNAAARLKRALVLGEVVKLEELEADEEEINSHIEKVSALWGDRADEVRSSLNSDAGRDTIRRQLLADKAVKRLIVIARGEGEVQEAESANADEAEGEY